MFTPVGRMGPGGKRLRTAKLLFALLLTMSLCGLWHGAGWTYIVWGTSQGIGLIFAAVWRRYLPSPAAVIGWAATLAYFALTAVMFRAPTLESAWHIWSGLAVLPSHDLTGANAIIATIFCAVVLPPTHEIIGRVMARPRPVIAYGTAALAAFCLLELGRGVPVNFIYFQF